MLSHNTSCGCYIEILSPVTHPHVFTNRNVRTFNCWRYLEECCNGTMKVNGVQNIKTFFPLVSTEKIKSHTGSEWHEGWGNWWHNLHFWHFQGTWWSQCDVSCLWERQPCVLLFYGYENMIYGGGVHGWAIRKRSQVRPKYCCKLVSCWGYRIPQTHQTAAGVSQGNMPRQSWIHTLTRKIFTGVIFNMYMKCD